MAKTITLHDDGSISMSGVFTHEEKLMIVRSACMWDEQTDNSEQEQILFYTGLKEDKNGKISLID